MEESNEILFPFSKNDFKNIYITVDSKLWKRPKPLSLEDLTKLFDLNSNANVISVEYKNQEQNPEFPPNTFGLNIKTHIAVDENYLYIWVPSLKKWKRVILSDWL